MMAKEYTERTYKEFVRLVELSESLQQMDRIEARLDFPPFIEKHGKDVCDAMFERLKAED